MKEHNKPHHKHPHNPGQPHNPGKQQPGQWQPQQPQNPHKHPEKKWQGGCGC